MRMVFIVMIIFFCGVGIAAADVCQHALMPTEEQYASDYARLQSYMRVNAAMEYDRYKSMRDEERATSGSWLRVFEGEYSDSKSGSEFQEKVNARLDREGGSGEELESKAGYRKYLSNEQLKAWSDCIIVSSGAGGVLVVPESKSQQKFALKVRYAPPQTNSGGKLTVRIIGGLIDGKTKINLRTEGTGTQAFAVTRNDDSEDALIIANYRDGISDNVLVKWGEEPPKVKLGNFKVNLVLCSNNAIARVAPCEHANQARFIDGKELVLLCSPGITNLEQGYLGSDPIPILPDGAEVIATSPQQRIGFPDSIAPKFILHPQPGPAGKEHANKSVSIAVPCKSTSADVGKQVMPLTVFYKK